MSKRKWSGLRRYEGGAGQLRAEVLAAVVRGLALELSRPAPALRAPAPRWPRARRRAREAHDGR